MFPDLFGKDSKGALKLWRVETFGDTITVTHGKLDGKWQTKDTVAKGKNIGKANETTPEQQAVVEAEAKWVKQKKQGYFETAEEALEFEEFSPMKCQDYKDHSHRVEFGGRLQPKLNGMRVLIDENGNAMSKAGEPYTLPKHLRTAIDLLRDKGKIPHGLDCEVYADVGVLSLQQIVSAFRKENENTSKLQLWFYDIPVQGIHYQTRVKMFEDLRAYIDGKDEYKDLKAVTSVIINSQDSYDKTHDFFVSHGYEGSVYRNLGGFYEFGKRSYDMLKRKPRQDTEARVLSVTIDKNEQGVLTCELENGVQFECLMRKDAHLVNYRLYCNAVNLVGNFVTVQFEEFSDAGVPTKPVGIGLRNVRVDNGKWFVLE
jgi:DNA ligase-1